MIHMRVSLNIGNLEPIQKVQLLLSKKNNSVRYYLYNYPPQIGFNKLNLISS